MEITGLDKVRDVVARYCAGVQIDHRGRRIWVCVDGVCILRVNAPEVEVTDLRESPTTDGGVVKFLERDDVLIGFGDGPEVIVHHKFWKWEGRAHRIIAAARQAMRAEILWKVKQGELDQFAAVDTRPGEVTE